jgi:hypothetical protein
MLGFIAQEIEQVFPNLVDEYSGMKSVKLSILTPMLVSCVQELTQKNNALESLVQDLLQRVAALERNNSNGVSVDRCKCFWSLLEFTYYSGDSYI